MATAAREHLHGLVDRLPEGEINAAERFLEFLASEQVGPTFSQSVRRGLADSVAGRTVDCATEEETFAKLLEEPAK